MEIYQVEPEEGEVEILHLSKEMILEDPDPNVAGVYHREVSYMSDHEVFHRLGRNGDYGAGWCFWKLWEKIEDVYQIGQEKAAKGWIVSWHPAYQPGLGEFTLKVAHKLLQ